MFTSLTSLAACYIFLCFLSIGVIPSGWDHLLTGFAVIAPASAQIRSLLLNEAIGKILLFYLFSSLRNLTYSGQVAAFRCVPIRQIELIRNLRSAISTQMSKRYNFIQGVYFHRFSCFLLDAYVCQTGIYTQISSIFIDI